MASKKPKITIKPFKHQVQMDPDYADKTWRLLKRAIDEIHRQNASGLSFEELYRNAYNMVLHKYGDKLYHGLQQIIEEHLAGVAKTVAASHDDEFLECLQRAWAQHKVSMLMIRDILMYMDRVYVMHNNVPPVFDLGLKIFREQVARSPHVKERLLKVLLEMVYRERTGEIIDRGLFRSITQMLTDLGVQSRAVYEDDFETFFLQASAQFYQLESAEYISSNGCPDYLRMAERRLSEEEERVAHYLDPTTLDKIREVCERELIYNHMTTLLNMEHSGFVSMLKDEKVEDLRRMYQLFGLKKVSGGLDAMRSLMGQYIEDTGKGIITDADAVKNYLELVKNLLELKDKFDALLANAFRGDAQFVRALHSSFEKFINLNDKSPEFLSLFINEKLIKGLKGATEEEIDTVLDKVMMLFRFLREKDVFEKYYKQHLAKRLLLGRSVSDDAERNMITKLKQECGYQFTSKLEGMFTDMKVGSDTMDAFRQFVKASDENPLKGIDLNVNVLTTGYWPTQSSVSCTLPPEVENCCEVFKQFYMSNHNGRRLQWQTNMGSAEVKAQFAAKKHELSVSTYQMVILMTFNSANEMDFGALKDASSIPVPDLKRNLLALSRGKYKVLVKNPPTNDCGETDKFLFNSKFRSKLFKIRIMQAVAAETKTERKETRQKVDEDRKHQIEAAIVRIMKARKELDHNNLVSETTKQLQSRFMPAPLLVKKRIESLIEREYLARDSSSHKLYRYLA